MNHDLNFKCQWAHYLRMLCSLDPQKQTVECILSTKRHEMDHPVIFSDMPMVKVEVHKNPINRNI